MKIPFLLLMKWFIQLFSTCIHVSSQRAFLITIIGNYTIDSCIISTSTLNGNGGGVSCSIQCSMIIRDTNFYECNASQSGGALYFSHSSSKLEQIRICSLRCKAGTGNNYGSYAFVSTQSNVQASNIISFVSISQCSPINGHGDGSIRMNNGNQTFNNFNSSNNRNQYNSGMYTLNANFFLGKECTFVNNLPSGYRCLGFLGTGGKVLNSNIINNTSTSTSYGVTYVASGVFSFEKSIFSMNIGRLFTINSGSFSINYCWIDHPLNSLTYGSISTTGISLGFTSTYILQHYSTKYKLISGSFEIICNAQNIISEFYFSSEKNEKKNFFYICSFNFFFLEI